MTLKNNTLRQYYIRGGRIKFNNCRFAIRQILLEHYGYECAKCHQVGDVTVDHIVPLSRGGVNDFNNFQLLCCNCNKSKDSKIIDYRTAEDRNFQWPAFDYEQLKAMNKKIRKQNATCNGLA